MFKKLHPRYYALNETIKPSSSSTSHITLFSWAVLYMLYLRGHQFPLRSMVGWPQPCLFFFYTSVFASLSVYWLSCWATPICVSQCLLSFLLLLRCSPATLLKVSTYWRTSLYIYNSFFFNLKKWLSRFFQESSFSWYEYIGHHSKILTFWCFLLNFLKLHWLKVKLSDISDMTYQSASC